MGIEPATGPEPSAISIKKAADALMAGEIVAIPTDTVYGLSADVSYTGAADRIFKAKRRSRDFTLPVLVADMEQALSVSVGVPEAAKRLMEKFWPGALTLVLPRHPDFVADLGSDEDTIGLRCPGHLVPRLLAEEVGPIATTSANISGQPPATTAEEVAAYFPTGVKVILDGGHCDGDPSTIVDVTGEEPKLLRQGTISFEEILAAIK